MHDSSVLSLLVFVVIGLVTLNAISYYANKLISLPNIIWTLLLGVTYGLAVQLTDLPLPEVSLSPEVVLFVFVPLLVFAATQKICLFHFRKVVPAASLLGTVGIVISMGVIASVLHFGFAFDWLSSLLFGVIMSATDPLAVGALLHGNKHTSPDTKLLIEGESILNDGFVVTVFGILLVLLLEQEGITWTTSTGLFVSHVAGALLLGTALARVTRWLLRVWHEEHFTFKINLTVALAFGSYLLAEHLGFSGILAVFAAALAFGYKPGPKNRQIDVRNYVWEYFEYLANAVLFFLLGASFMAGIASVGMAIPLLLVSLALLFFARLVSIGILWPVVARMSLTLTKIDFWLLNVAGARGAVSVALILLLPAEFAYKSLFLGLAFYMILFSLLVYPLITKWLLTRNDM